MILLKDYYEEFELDLTGTCNLRCPLCTRNYAHGQRAVYENVRPMSEIIAQLDEYPNLKKAFVAGQVSEPTLHPEFLDYLRYLKSRDIFVRFFTNGSTHTPEYWTEVGNILTDDDECHFTVCGSTQELHEKYRVGSSLQKILNNAEGYRRSGRVNDFCQFIEFKYNTHDWVNVKKMNFSNHYLEQSEGDRMLNDKVEPVCDSIRPVANRDKLIKWVLGNRPKKGASCIDCISIKYRKIYINQSGKVYPCYMHSEYDWDDDFRFDYADILNHEFDKCSICDKQVRWKIKALGLNFVC